MAIACTSCTGSKRPDGFQPISVVADHDDRVLAENDLFLVSKIHEGMTFEEVRAIVPLSMSNLVMVTHGGAWFGTRLRGGFFVVLRFTRPTSVDEYLREAAYKSCTLNLSPSVRKGDSKPSAQTGEF